MHVQCSIPWKTNTACEGAESVGFNDTQAMDVVDKTGSTWRVLRRYNHFDAFRKALRCKRLPRSAAFPGRPGGGFDQCKTVGFLGVCWKCWRVEMELSSVGNKMLCMMIELLRIYIYIRVFIYDYNIYAYIYVCVSYNQCVSCSHLNILMAFLEKKLQNCDGCFVCPCYSERVATLSQDSQ